MPHSEFKKRIDEAVQNYLNEVAPRKEVPGLLELHRSVSYSLTNGGSRFRPRLCLLVTEAMGGDIDRAMAFAIALEMVHTYSLIHDDLPAMDNDDLRRGQPTNHKVFGESMAILAGDALATEPYGYIAQKYSDDPSLALKLIQTLAKAAGPQGMVGGQAVDILMSRADHSAAQADIEFLHNLKTVALFRAAVRGGGLIAGATESQLALLDEYAQAVGLLFQIADDIADGTTDGEASMLRAVGLEKAVKSCQNLKEISEKKAIDLNLPGSGSLVSFSQMIFERTAHAP